MKERLPDVFRRLVRGPQIITLKDAAVISAFTGISSGDIVVDAGAGSGFLAIYLGNLVRPDGKVFSYEKRHDFAKLAERNVVKAGLEKFVEIKEKDITEGIDEKDVDVITLDLQQPSLVLTAALRALMAGGYVVSYVPNVEQAKETVLEGQKLGFFHERTVECSIREMLVRDFGTRPQTKGLMHTGYITFLRKPKG